MVEKPTTDRLDTDALPPRGTPIDGLVVGSAEIWLVVTGGDEDALGLLLGHGGQDSEPPLRVCREVREDGTVVIGDPDPAQDQLLSVLLRGNRCGQY